MLDDAAALPSPIIRHAHSTQLRHKAKGHVILYLRGLVLIIIISLAALPAVAPSTASVRLTPRMASTAAVDWRGEEESNRSAGGAGAASGPRRAAYRAQPL